MRKVFLTMLLAVGYAASVMAVEIPKQGFGIQIGWAQPILRLNSPTNPATSKDSLSNTIKMNGFKVGLTYDASYFAGFGSSMGINYTFGAYNGGWQSMHQNQPTTYPRKRQMFTYNEIELFVDWQYKFEVAKETYLILYTGPTLQCGVTFDMRMDEQSENPLTGEITTDEGDWKSAYKIDKDDNIPVKDRTGKTHVPSDNALTRLNITWGVGAGFQYKRYFLRGGYDFGLMNPYKHSDFANEKHTRGRLDQWNIRLGVYLWYHE